MHLLNSIWIDKNQEHFDNSNPLRLELLLDPNGGLSSGPSGVRVTVDRKSFRGILNPVGNIITLPTANDATVNPGINLEAGDRFLIASAGTIGNITVNIGGELVVNGNSLPPTIDEHFQYLAPTADVSLFITNARQVIAGNGLIGGGDLSSDRTLSVKPDIETGGAIKPVVVSNNGVGINTIGLRTQVDKFVITTNQITLSTEIEFTLSQTPINSNEVQMTIEGAPSQNNGTGFTVINRTVTISNVLKSLMSVGDNVTFRYSY